MQQLVVKEQQARNALTHYTITPERGHPPDKQHVLYSHQSHWTQSPVWKECSSVVGPFVREAEEGSSGQGLWTPQGEEEEGRSVAL
jgi:hypothetical protein